AAVERIGGGVDAQRVAAGQAAGAGVAGVAAGDAESRRAAQLAERTIGVGETLHALVERGVALRARHAAVVGGTHADAVAVGLAVHLAHRLRIAPLAGGAVVGVGGAGAIAAAAHGVVDLR